LVRNKVLDLDPTFGIQSPKIEKRQPSILSSQEVNLLLEQPKGEDLKSIRDKAMLEIAYATGMRVTEIISLNVEDIDFENTCVLCKNANKILPGASSYYKRYYSSRFKTFFCNTFIAKRSWFEINTDNVSTFRYFINTGIHAISRWWIEKYLQKSSSKSINRYDNK